MMAAFGVWSIATSSRVGPCSSIGRGIATVPDSCRSDGTDLPRSSIKRNTIDRGPGVMDEAEAKEVETKMGAILEQLAARFDLVLEPVTGFGRRLDALREEIVGQFSEVGRQVRFLSDRIAENRESVAVTRSDLGAEMVRIGENLGATRVEFREQLAATRLEFQQQVANEAERGRQHLAAELGRAATEARDQLRRDIAAGGDAL